MCSRLDGALVDGNHNDVVVPPGTVGFVVGDGAYADFDDCVAANLVLAPIDFDFGGGVLGVWLDDNPCSDNVVGENGRSPTWKLAAGVPPRGRRTDRRQRFRAQTPPR